jgi:hypothetical protein
MRLQENLQRRKVRRGGRSITLPIASTRVWLESYGILGNFRGRYFGLECLIRRRSNSGAASGFCNRWRNWSDAILSCNLIFKFSNPISKRFDITVDLSCYSPERTSITRLTQSCRVSTTHLCRCIQAAEVAVGSSHNSDVFHHTC